MAFEVQFSPEHPIIKKRSKTMQLISQIIRLIPILALALFCTPSWATPQQMLSDLQLVRLNAAASMTNFYMYTGLDLDSRYKQRLEQNHARFTQAFTSAEKIAAANSLTTEVAELKSTWQKFDQLVNDNLREMERQGFPNVRLVDDMGNTSNQLIEMATAARDKLYESSGIKASEVVTLSRELALLMERITAQYAARGTSNLGQVFVGNSEQTLPEMAEVFAKELQKLNKAATFPGSENILNSIQSKWRFMEERIRNYNQNAVVFLVVSYNDRIIEHLQELEAQYL